MVLGGRKCISREFRKSVKKLIFFENIWSALRLYCGLFNNGELKSSLKQPRGDPSRPPPKKKKIFAIPAISGGCTSSIFFWELSTMFAFVPKKLTFHPLRVQYLLAGTSQVSYRHWRMWEDYLNDHNMPTKRIMNLLFFNQTYLNTSISRSVFAVTCSGHSIKIIEV